MRGKRFREDVAGSLRAQFGEDDVYLCYHAPRYAFLLDLLDPHLAIDEPRAILDVGTSVLTNLLRERYGHPTDTLDLVPAEARMRGFSPPSPGEGTSYVFDLNELQCREGPPDLGRYDIVLFCEVLEHLHISPGYVFPFLRRLLQPTGLLVVQTPNAASISKRVKLVLGRNPYGLIGDDPLNPGHFREYTLTEVRRFGTEADLEVVSARYASYFDVRYREPRPDSRSPFAGRMLNALYGIVPPSWRLGITVVFAPGNGRTPGGQPPP